MNRIMKWMMAAAAMLPTQAWANFTVEYYAYNAFEETRDGFLRLALWMSDPTTLTIAAIFLILGILLAAISAGAKGMMGSNENPINWVWPILIGMVVFLGAVVPKAQVQVYDPIQNRTEMVNDVPGLVALIAGAFNLVERAVVEVIDTGSASPYRGNMVEFIANHAALRTGVGDMYLARSLGRYYEDCGVINMARGINGASERNFRRGTTDQAQEWATWTNNALYTVIYRDSAPSGESMTCTQAWNELGPQVTAGGATSMAGEGIERVCETIGMNGSAQARQGCREALEEAALFYGVSGASAEQLMRSIMLTRAVVRAWETGDYAGAMNRLIDRSVMAEGIGAAAAMDQWAPKLRGYLLVTVLSMSAIILIFLVTPLFMKSFLLLIGLFAWLTLWGITDAMAMRSAADAAVAAMSHVARFQLGIEGILAAPEASVKALGLFGQARTHAMMTATVLAAALFGFGGYAFTSMAAGHASHLRDVGTQAGRDTFLPEEQAARQAQMMAGRNTAAEMGSYGFDGAAAGRGFGQREVTESMVTAAAGSGLNIGDVAPHTGAMRGAETAGGVMGTYDAGGGSLAGGLAETTLGARGEKQFGITEKASFTGAARETPLGIGGAGEVAGAIRGTQQQVESDIGDSLGVDARSGEGAQTVLEQQNAARRAEARVGGSLDAVDHAYGVDAQRHHGTASELTEAEAFRSGQRGGFSERIEGAATEAGRDAFGDRAFERQAERRVGQDGGAGRALGELRQPGLGFGGDEGGLSVARSAADHTLAHRVAGWLSGGDTGAQSLYESALSQDASGFRMAITPDMLDTMSARLEQYGLIDNQTVGALHAHGGGEARFTLDPQTGMPVEAGYRFGRETEERAFFSREEGQSITSRNDNLVSSDTSYHYGDGLAALGRPTLDAVGHIFHGGTTALDANPQMNDAALMAYGDAFSGALRESGFDLSAADTHTRQQIFGAGLAADASIGTGQMVPTQLNAGLSANARAILQGDRSAGVNVDVGKVLGQEVVRLSHAEALATVTERHGELSIDASAEERMVREREVMTETAWNVQQRFVAIQEGAQEVADPAMRGARVDADGDTTGHVLTEQIGRTVTDHFPDLPNSKENDRPIGGGRGRRGGR